MKKIIFNPHNPPAKTNAVRLLFLFFILTETIYCQVKIGLAKNTIHKYRLSVDKVIEDPVIRLYNSDVNVLLNTEIISYTLVLKTNREEYVWENQKSDTLSENVLSKLRLIDDLNPDQNFIKIKNLKLRTSNELSENPADLQVFLGKDVNCDCRIKVELEKFKRSKNTRFKLVYCDDNLLSIKEYRKNGSVMGIKTNFNDENARSFIQSFRKNGSKLLEYWQTSDLDDGDYYIFYPNGVVKLQANNKLGKRINEKIFDQNGLIVSETIFEEESNNCKKNYYDVNGSIIKSINFDYKGLYSRREN